MLQFIKEKRLAQFDGILYIFDLTDPKSMIDLEQLHYEIKQNYKEEFSCLLVGNKADLLTAVKDLKTQQ
jgi:ribosome biogenesis GTPase A